MPKHKHVRARVGNVQDLDIPPGENNVRVDGYTVLKDNIRMTVFQPHLHNRGKRQCMEAIYPDGRVETLNCVNWNFGWHIAYNYNEDVQPLLPKGARSFTSRPGTTTRRPTSGILIRAIGPATVSARAMTWHSRTSVGTC